MVNFAMNGNINHLNIVPFDKIASELFPKLEFIAVTVYLWFIFSWMLLKQWCVIVSIIHILIVNWWQREKLFVWILIFSIVGIFFFDRINSRDYSTTLWYYMVSIRYKYVTNVLNPFATVFLNLQFIILILLIELYVSRACTGVKSLFGMWLWSSVSHRKYCFGYGEIMILLDKKLLDHLVF